MIPKVQDDLVQDFEIEEQPTKTYYLDIDKNIIVGQVDGIEAIKQAIYKILNTERYDYLIYSWNYGLELKNLYGENNTYVIPELQRIITEALMQDTRVIEVNNFNFQTNKKEIIATFNVDTIIGNIEVERVVGV